MATKIKKAKPTKAKPLAKLPGRVPSPIAIGIDLSPASLACSAKMYDGIIKTMRGPVWSITRWPKGTDHFEKLEFCARGYDVVLDILAPLGGFIKEIDDLHIGVEELPARVLNSNRAHQQAELIGAFVGSLLRYGWKNIYLIPVKSWQALVANDLEMKANKDFDKWHVKEWAIEVYGAPKWKDLIRSGKLGLIPRPKTSKAMAEQPDDRYDATGIMDYVWEKAFKDLEV
jgi:hypothetical protein